LSLKNRRTTTKYPLSPLVFLCAGTFWHILNKILASRRVIGFGSWDSVEDSRPTVLFGGLAAVSANHIPAGLLSGQVHLSRRFAAQGIMRSCNSMCNLQ
jgi:hypothetical protein